MRIAVETLILLIVVALILRLLFPAIEKNPKFMTKFKPCRGKWWEAYIRGCEHWTKHLPVEPVNSYSNLAYLATGYVTFRLTGSLPAAWFALAMAYLCVGSALYHGVKTIWAAALDHSGMYAVFGALAFYAMAPTHRLVVIPEIIGSIGAAYFLRYAFPGSLDVRMGVLLSLMLVGALFRGNALLGLLSIGLFAVAWGIWWMDKKKIVWHRWGHGLWHLLTAMAISAMFLGLTP